MSTSFSFEVPLDHWKDFYDLQDYGFFLSMHMNDRRTQEYYAACKKDGKLTIIDNSFNELQIGTSWKEMAFLYHVYTPDYIISPDDDNWIQERVAAEFKALSKEVPPERILAIFKTREEFKHLEWSGVKTFACSYEQREELGSNSAKARHFLGLIDPMEIWKYKPVTCDTAMPLKIALAGLTLDEWIFKGCHHIHTRGNTYFETPMTSGQIHLARTNILALKEVCKW